MFFSYLILLSISILIRLTVALHLPVLNNDSNFITRPDLTPLLPSSPSVQFNALNAAATPTCFPNPQPADPNNNTVPAPHLNPTYIKDCLQALDSFLTYPTISSTAYRWQRMPPHSIPPPGYQSLPFRVGTKSCVLTIDIIQHERVVDVFSLFTLRTVVGALVEKCVRGKGGEGNAGSGRGMVGVGRKGVLGVWVGPREMGMVGKGEGRRG